MNIFVIILIGFLGIQILASVVFGIIGREAAKNLNNVDTNKTTTATSTSRPAATPPPVNYNSSTYSYESSFTYNSYSYTCTRAIAGNWVRVGTQTAGNTQQNAAFSFVPANQDDLANYCSR